MPHDNGGLPEGWHRLTVIEGMGLFVHGSDGAPDGTAVFAYEQIHDSRRVMITMRGRDRLPAPAHLEALANTLVPGVPMRWTMGGMFGGHPFTLVVIEDDGNPMPPAFQFERVTSYARGGGEN